MSLRKNYKNGYIGFSTSLGGVFDINTSSKKVELKSFSYVEYSNANGWTITVPADTAQGDLMIVMSGCRDGRTQSNFTFTGTASFTDLASGLNNIFCRYATANSGDAGTVITTTWNSNTTGPIGLYVFDGGVYTNSSIQGGTGSNYTLNAPSGYNREKSVAILFNQDRADNVITPGLSEVLRDAAIGTSSYYEFHIERTASSIVNQDITNVSSDSVGAYIVVSKF